VYVFADPAGRFAGHENITNRTARYLNRVVIAWRVLDPRGRRLARGQTRWPSLAPRETATIHFRASAPYSRAWSRVQFLLIRD